MSGMPAASPSAAGPLPFPCRDCTQAAYSANAADTPRMSTTLPAFMPPPPRPQRSKGQVWLDGLPVHVGDAPRKDDRPLLHDVVAARQLQGELQVLLDQQHGHPALGLERLQDATDLGDDRRLNALGRLV